MAPARQRGRGAAAAAEEEFGHPRLQELLDIEENRSCADCGGGQATWSSVNIGVFLCLECAGIHRGVGVHISQVRSVELDRWKDEWVDCCRQVGNGNANRYYEQRYQGTQKPGPEDSRQAREVWIRSKYEHKLFAPAGVASPRRLRTEVGADAASTAGASAIAAASAAAEAHRTGTSASASAAASASSTAGPGPDAAASAARAASEERGRHVDAAGGPNGFVADFAALAANSSRADAVADASVADWDTLENFLGEPEVSAADRRELEDFLGEPVSSAAAEQDWLEERGAAANAGAVATAGTAVDIASGYTAGAAVGAVAFPGVDVRGRLEEVEPALMIDPSTGSPASHFSLLSPV